MRYEEMSFAQWLGAYQERGGWDDRAFFCGALRLEALLEEYEQGLSPEEAYDQNEAASDG